MKSHEHEIVEVVKVKEFGAAYRWQHWVRALAILILTVTGFYIGYPFIAPVSDPEPTNFMYALFRAWHEIFGFVLIAVVIYKSYLFLFSQTHENERAAIKDLKNFKIWRDQIGYYLLLTRHPKLSGVYNPIQFVAYVGFYFMVFLIIVTGLILYVHVYHEGLGAVIYAPMRFLEESVFGNLANVRAVHHITMWGIIIFVFAHIYMVIFNTVHGKEGAMDAIFSGLKWHKKDH